MPVQERDISSMTLAIDRKKLQKAKELINKFKDDMEELIESNNPDDVYNLSIQLFPLTVRTGETNATL